MESPSISNEAEKGPRVRFFDAGDADGSGGHPPLGKGEIHLWRAGLFPDAISGGIEELSEDERVRANQFHFEKDRKRCIAKRLALRRILGRYLDMDPRDIAFARGSFGKPVLFPNCGNLCFNVSDSRDLAVFAFARECPLGVDVEAIRPMEEIRSIVSRFFAREERLQFQKIEESQKLEAFYNCWTRKEAYVKALGKGLRQPLDGFEVAFAPGLPARLVRVGHDPREASRWSILGFVPETGYVGALAFRRETSG